MTGLKLGVALPLISGSTNKYHDLEARLRLVKRNHFHGVELNIDDPRRIEPEKIRGLLGEFDLELAAIGTGMTYSKFGLSFLDDRIEVRRSAISRARQYIRLASSLNCPVILALIRGRYSARLGNERAERRLSRTLRTLYGYAEASGVKLLLEPVNRYELNLIHTLSDAAKTILESDTPGIRILADTYHMNIEERSAVQAVRSFGPHIGHVHLADCNRGPPKQGHIDFEAILNALSQTSYRNWVSAEIIFKPSETQAMRQTSQAICPLI